MLPTALCPLTVILKALYTLKYKAPGGHSHWKGVWGCAAVMTPFFQASRRSLAHKFTVNAQLMCPLFSISRKFSHFQPCFGQNSSSLDPNFSKFSFPGPPFFKGKPAPYTLHFETRVAHTYKKKKKKLSAPGTKPKHGITGLYRSQVFFSFFSSLFLLFLSPSSFFLSFFFFHFLPFSFIFLLCE